MRTVPACVVVIIRLLEQVVQLAVQLNWKCRQARRVYVVQSHFGVMNKNLRFSCSPKLAEPTSQVCRLLHIVGMQKMMLSDC